MSTSANFISPQYFDASRSLQYDRKIKASMPGYEAIHAMTHDFLRLALPESANILVVGAGTGMELVTLGIANPGWRFTAVDTSAEMIEVCRNTIRNAGVEERVTIHLGPIDELPQHESFHAATSILVSHFIPATEERLAFYKAISSRLCGKGIFIIADLMGEKDSARFDLLMNAWKSHYAFAGITPQEVEEDFARTKKVVSFIPENSLYSLLADGGFVDICHFYRAFLFCGYVCWKG